MSGTYVDTSALAKWYLNESGSEAFGRFMQTAGEAVTGRLTLVEMRCLLARRCRAGELSMEQEGMAYSLLIEQVGKGYVGIQPMPELLLDLARQLIERLSSIPLRTLDALHLAAAQVTGAQKVATADRVMAEAARQLGLGVRYFGSDRMQRGSQPH